MRLSRRLVGARAPGAHGPAGKSLSATALKVPASCALSGRCTVGASRVQRGGGDLHERQAEGRELRCAERTFSSRHRQLYVAH